MERVAAETGFSGVVRVDRDGEVRLAKAYGLAHRGWGVANTIDTRFAIASGTKGLTAHGGRADRGRRPGPGHDRPDQEEAEMDAQAAARRWAATWTVAWQAHDVEAVVALYAEECVHRSTPFRPPHRGRQAVRDYVTQAFADEQRIDDVRFGTPVVQGDRACVEYWASFLDQQGTAMTLAGCAMARFDADGLITEARDYWHLQEGHQPPPDWDR